MPCLNEEDEEFNSFIAIENSKLRYLTLAIITSTNIEHGHGWKLHLAKM